MMSNAFSLFNSDFGGSYVHILVQLHRISINDFGINFLSKCYSEITLTCGGCTTNDDQFHRLTVGIPSMVDAGPGCAMRAA